MRRFAAMLIPRRRCRCLRVLTPTGWAAVAFLLAAIGVAAQLPWSDLP